LSSQRYCFPLQRFKNEANAAEKAADNREIPQSFPLAVLPSPPAKVGTHNPPPQVLEVCTSGTTKPYHPQANWLPMLFQHWPPCCEICA